jgi:hypothetical protein
MEAVLRTGSLHGERGGLKTVTPLPAVPKRKVWFNGHEASALGSRNYRDWHPGDGIYLPSEIIDDLKGENELVIEPVGPKDFFKIRNLRLTVMLADGRKWESELVKETYSSCQHPEAEGKVGSPIRIPIRISPR